MNREVMSAVLDAMTQAAKQGCEPNVLSFENEEMALAYAQRVARLQPGDVVGLGGSGEELYPAVFVCFRPEKGAFVYLRYNSEDGELVTGNATISCLHLDFPWPPRAEVRLR